MRKNERQSRGSYSAQPIKRAPLLQVNASEVILLVQIVQANCHPRISSRATDISR